MLSDFFDTMGTLVGVGGQAGLPRRQGPPQEVNRPLLVDSLAAVAGGAASASSATTYIESGAGRRPRRAHGLGGHHRRHAVPAGHVLLADRRHRAGRATAPALDHRRLPDDGHADGRRDDGRGEERHGTVKSPTPPSTSATSPSASPPCSHDHHAAHLQHHERHRLGFLAYTLIRIVQGKAKDVSWMLWIATVGFLIYFLVPLAPGEGLGLRQEPRGPFRPTT